MKHFYICTREAWETFPKEQFGSSHCIETTDQNKLLVVITFNNESAHEFWENADGVEPLPHLLLPKSLLPTEHMRLLEHIGVEAGDDTLAVAEKAAAIHPCFNPRRG